MKRYFYFQTALKDSVNECVFCDKDIEKGEIFAEVDEEIVELDAVLYRHFGDGGAFLCKECTEGVTNAKGYLGVMDDWYNKENKIEFGCMMCGKSIYPMDIHFSHEESKERSEYWCEECVERRIQAQIKLGMFYQ